MDDPMTLAHSFKLPLLGTIDIWHVDPETDGTDDSCGWHMQARHGSEAELKQMIQNLDFDWDASFGGWFDSKGKLNFTRGATMLHLFRHAAKVRFGSWKKSDKFCKKHLIEILHFAENPIDSLSLERNEGRTREDHLNRLAYCIYGYVLRKQRPWWRHPRWHVHHWKINVSLFQKIHKRLFIRCSVCGKPFGWNESATADWGGGNRRHHNCEETYVAIREKERSTVQ